MDNCVFCKIINKEISVEPIYEDQDFLVIPDKFPKAPVHILVIPKKHIQSIAHMQEEDSVLIGRLIFLAKNIAEQRSIEDYKLIFNVGKYVEVPHIHLHLIAGENLGQVMV